MSPSTFATEMTFHPVMALSEVLELALEPVAQSLDVSV